MDSSMLGTRPARRQEPLLRQRLRTTRSACRSGPDEALGHGTSSLRLAFLPHLDFDSPGLATTRAAHCRRRGRGETGTSPPRRNVDKGDCIPAPTSTLISLVAEWGLSQPHELIRAEES
jgi:hypothetical protein